MTRLVDTTLRLLAQEPLAGRIPTGALLDLAGLDEVGYDALEVTGGGCFREAVVRGVESPWERIRALKRATRTPLVMALRGTFLVGARPAERRPRAPLHPLRGRVGHRHLPAARPAQRRDDLAVPAEAVREAGAGCTRASSTPTRRAATIPGRAGPAPARAGRRPDDAARPRRRARAAPRRRAGGAHARGRRRARRPLLPGRRRHRARRLAGGRPRGRRPGRDGRLPGRDGAYRASAELFSQALAASAATRARPRPRWEVATLDRRAHRRRGRSCRRVSPHVVAAGRAEPRPRRPRRRPRAPARRLGAADRLDEVLEELHACGPSRLPAARLARRADPGARRSSTCSPAARWDDGRRGDAPAAARRVRPDAGADRRGRARAVRRGDAAPRSRCRPRRSSTRAEAGGIARAPRRSCACVALFGEDARAAARARARPRTSPTRDDGRDADAGRGRARAAAGRDPRGVRASAS